MKKFTESLNNIKKVDPKTIAKAVQSDATPAKGGGTFGKFIKQ